MKIKIRNIKDPKFEKTQKYFGHSNGYTVVVRNNLVLTPVFSVETDIGAGDDVLGIDLLRWNHSIHYYYNHL